MQQASIHFTSDVTVIDTVRQFVKDRTSGLGLGDDGLYTVQLAVVEAVTNVIVHAYDGAEGRPITLEIESDEGGVTFVLRDEGRSFDLQSHPDPDIRQHVSEKRRGGLGVYLMRKLMDDLELRREGPCNVLRMRKRFA